MTTTIVAGIEWRIWSLRFAARFTALSLPV